jgi:tetraprenyl-beta-curcumene synthase
MRQTHAPRKQSTSRLAASSGAALLTANVKYWSQVAPQVSRELLRWRTRANAIPDPLLRDLALGKLEAEDFNAQVAATLATLVPRSRRPIAVEAIVALEVMYDYLDGLTESKLKQPLRDSARLFDAFIDALRRSPPASTDYYEHQSHHADGGYLLELSTTVREAITQLPASAAVAEQATRAARRCAEGQVRVHASPQVGLEQLRQWAHSAAPHGLPWRDFVAGAVASVLAVHAQIAAAACERTTAEDSAALDEVYLSICALSTMLDSLVDYERDLAAGEPWLVELYGDPRSLAQRLSATARASIARVAALRDRGHHLMTLAGVITYYSSAPEARRGQARREIAQLHRELIALLMPPLIVMRLWRLAKQARARLRSGA